MSKRKKSAICKSASIALVICNSERLDILHPADQLATPTHDRVGKYY